ncbi:molybdate ABC transporter substrate-binding protein [Alteripontixanthobacter muriae]|uniref:molybdate ABC transporter substrate-binding protein n=1 Tax=Alteripontixanthobacter muriae TaxID=2705546 RepID=UPI001E4316EA|nr:molybdate ABC transporter substrate-binding protein [Alteripontixanthobacter muriae]
MFTVLVDRLRAAASFVLALSCALLLQACAPEGSERGPVVLAASSMQEALEEVARAWTAQGHPPPVLSFASSSALARQIEQGAPADLFVSADTLWMDRLDGKGLLASPGAREILGNRMVIIRPATGGSPALREPQAVLAELGDDRLATGDPDSVPAGRYAKASLETLGLWPEVAPSIVRAENVRAALALVERGEARLGIVYATDAAASREVSVAAQLPADSHPPITYPASQLASSAHPDAAAFLDYLANPAAMEIFARHGFCTATTPC